MRVQQEQRNDTLRPVTIKQVNDAREAPDGAFFNIDNSIVTQVCTYSPQAMTPAPLTL
jgi:hypothetical protein